MDASTTTVRPHGAVTIMEISPGPISFGFVSTFLSLITTEELPYESLRDVLHSNLTLVEFASNAIELESGFITLMVAFVFLALIPCLATCAWCCSKRPSVADVERHKRSTAQSHGAEEAELDCTRRASKLTLWIAFIVVVCSALSMLYANASIESAIDSTPDMVKSTVHDVEAFVRDAHLQIKYKLENGFHISVEQVVKDLEDVDVLLGVPIQAEVAAQTGIELAFDSLATITLANTELVYRVMMLQETIARALKISQEAATRMEELQIQLSVLQRQCTYRDRPLCDTLRIRSFEENGVVDVLKTLQEDQTIFRLRYLGEVEAGSAVRNISSEAAISRSMFGNFPQQVKRDTSYQRNYTLEQLESIRHRTTTNAQMLTATVDGILHRLQGSWESIEPKYKQLKELALIYRNVGWLVAMLIIWVLILVVLAYSCLLCESHTKAGAMFLIASIIICVSSLAIALYGLVSLTIGGNAEVFLCRPLYDKMNRAGANERFSELGKLLDRPGYLYAHEPRIGIVGELLRPEDVNRTYVNVSLAAVLRGCEENRASYNVFQLDAFVNTTKLSHVKDYSKVTSAIDGITASERTLLSLTQTVQNILENMLQTATFNLTAYRNSIAAPTPEKDLATFIDQMQRVALQTQDVATSSRMATLGSRSKRMQSAILQPLQHLQNEILYHLTALELQREPWARQVNQTLNHLRNIQGYLETTAAEICHNQTRLYTDRLKELLKSSGATLSSQLGETTAKCLPFFNIFDANRVALCGNIVDNVNALWFFALLILLLWSISTPVGLRLHIITIQRQMHAQLRAQRRTNTSSSPDRQADRCNARLPRERSASRQRQPIKRTATEETLDMAAGEDDAAQAEEQRRLRSHSRFPNMSTPTTPSHHTASSQQLRMKWTTHRGESASRKESQTKANKKTLQKQNTEESEMDEGDRWQDREQPQERLHLRGGRNKQRARTVERESTERDPERSITPVLPNNPDALPATPMARTPTRLHRLHLTTRAMANIAKGGNSSINNNNNNISRNKLQRGGTEEYDMDNDESETYGESGLASNTLYNMRHTPPMTAPPPPPPPGPTSSLFRRY